MTELNIENLNFILWQWNMIITIFNVDIPIIFIEIIRVNKK